MVVSNFNSNRCTSNPVFDVQIPHQPKRKGINAGEKSIHPGKRKSVGDVLTHIAA